MTACDVEVVARDLVAAGFRTRYLESGTEHAAAGTVLLVHDGAYGAAADVTWSAVIQVLARQFHVVAPDMLGYGGTDKVVFLDRSPYEYRIAHLAAFCERIGLSQVHAVGSSFGGSVLLRAAADRPGRLPLASVASIAGTGGPWRTPEGAAALSAYDGTVRDVERIVRLMVDEYPGLATQVRARYRNTLLPGHVEACNAPRLRNPAMPSRPVDPWPTPLADSEVPVLLIAGRRDALLEEGWTGHFAGFPRVSVAEMDCRHAPNLDRAAELAEVLTAFFSSVPVLSPDAAAS